MLSVVRSKLRQKLVCACWVSVLYEGWFGIVFLSIKGVYGYVD